jgi:hypothetical protein
MTERAVERQERIDELLLPYRKMSMAVKMAKWEIEAMIPKPVSSTDASCARRNKLCASAEMGRL